MSPLPAVVQAFYNERNEEIKKLRFDDGLTLIEIGSRFEISRERVRQIVGNTGYLANEKRIEYIRASVDKTNKELVEELGLKSSGSISSRRSDVRHAVEQGGSVYAGFIWEEWASRQLTRYGVENELMPCHHPFDILAMDSVRIDVKSRTQVTIPPSMRGRLKSPLYKFNIMSHRRDNADAYLLIIAKYQVVLVVPSSEIPLKQESISLIWPPVSAKSKWHLFHNRFDIIERMAKNGKQASN